MLLRNLSITLLLYHNNYFLDTIRCKGKKEVNIVYKQFLFSSFKRLHSLSCFNSITG